MTKYIKENINLTLVTSLVFSFIPASFIFGNLITNLTFVIFCLLGAYQLKSKILKIKLNFSFKIIFLLFLIVLFSTSINFFKSVYLNEFQQDDLTRLIKAIVFMRFFLFLVITYLLCEFNLLKFKYFFLTSALFPILISIDIFYQSMFGFNIIGIESTNVRINSSFFGDEFIAGGYIKNFAFFSILLIPFIFKDKKNIQNILIIISICILGAGIILSGNRMPLPQFIFGLFLLIWFIPKLRKTVSLSIMVFLLVFTLIYKNNNDVRKNYRSFYGAVKNISEKVFKNSSNIKSTPDNEIENKFSIKKYEFFGGLKITAPQTIHGHSKIFATAIDTWSLNKIYGNGIKSFRKDCIIFSKKKINRICSNHPHNYYFEILTETGIIGLITVIVLAAIFIVFIFRHRKIFKGNFILLAAIISLILETFPIKSTGSIFTTNNATYLILLTSIVISYKKILLNNNLK